MAIINHVQKTLLILLFAFFWFFNGQAQSLEITKITPASGAANSEITIYGIGFDASSSDNTVTFTLGGGGTGTTATVTGGSSNHLTVTVPSGLTGGNYNIGVERASDGSTAGFPLLFDIAGGGGDFATAGSSKQTITSSVYSDDMVSADLDGDGDQDLISISRSDNKIIWFENDGSGSFGSATEITTLNVNPRSIVANDMDNDGDLDIAALGADITNTDPYTYENDRAWFENDGNGNFNTKHTISTTDDGIGELYAADFDQDGDIDIALSSFEVETVGGSNEVNYLVAWYENDGTGSFNALQNINTNLDGADGIHAADLDNDSDQDLIIIASDTFEFLENNGDGTFQSEQTVGSGLDNPKSVFATDLNGDGDLDLLGTSANDDEVVWYDNNGSGSFGSQNVITSATDNPYDAHAVDLDADGDQDVVSASYSDDKIAWYKNDGSGSFGSQLIINDTERGAVVISADFNNDGLVDLASGSGSDDEIAWYENNNPIGPHRITKVEPRSGAPESTFKIYGRGFAPGAANNEVSFGDIPGNSDYDLTVTSATSTILTVEIPTFASSDRPLNGTFTVHTKRSPSNPTDENSLSSPLLFEVINGGGGFGDPSSSQQVISTSADQPYSLFYADLDGDDDHDLLSASRSDNTIAWYENNGNGSFGSEQIITTNTNDAVSVFAGDIDNDGDIDVLSGSQGDNTIAWYKNDGSGSFGTQQVISSSAGNPHSVFTVDADLDGDLDVVFTSQNGDEIAWHKNTDGAGTFGSKQVISGAVNAPTSVISTDIDGDSDPDLITTSSGDNKIAWYANDGTGSFGSQQVITSSATGAQDVFAGDIDGDGDPDLAAVYAGGQKVVWFENTDGNGTFGSEQSIGTTSQNAQSVSLGDVNGDGDPDVFAVTTGKVFWYENTDGSGAFGGQQEISSEISDASSVILFDVDSDKDLDAITASESDDKIAWYENTGVPAGTPLVVNFMSPVDVSPGTEFEIRGHGFDASASDNTVTFTPAAGGTSTQAKVESSSANKLLVTAPSGITGGMYSVEVERASDQSSKTLPQKLSVPSQGHGFGDPATSRTVISSAAETVNDVHTADLDGDGDPDVLSASWSDDKIAWYENTGGSFGTQQVITINADQAMSVFAADLDGDRDLDVLSASEGDDKIAWYENTDGNGSFGAQQVIRSDMEDVQSIRAGDLDNDGDPDLVAAVPFPGNENVFWFENIGGGEFGAPQVVSQPAGADYDDVVFAEPADIDGDGDLDIVAAQVANQDVEWFENTDGNGSFSEENYIGAFNGSFEVADMDADGDLDVISSGTEIEWYENTDGSGAFNTTKTISDEDPEELFISDLEGDGDMDVVAGFYWHRNLGGGDFPDTYSSGNDGEEFTSNNSIDLRNITGADIDGDGDIDLVTADGDDDAISWYENTYGTQKIYSTNNDLMSDDDGSHTVELAYPVDYDGDGDQDLIADFESEFSPSGVDTLYKVQNNGGGNFTKGQAIGMSTFGQPWEWIEAADVDADTDIDILAAQSDLDSSPIILFENQAGQGNFQSGQTLYTHSDLIQMIRLGDLNDDGYPDLLAASDQKIMKFLNNGDGTFPATPSNITSSVDDLQAIFLKDLDGDDVPDLMSASRTDNKIAWYQNNGSGAFGSQNVVDASANEAYWVQAADLDNDGDNDMVSSSEDGITWYENTDGAGNFSTSHTISDDDNPEMLQITDYDFDGDQDVLTNNISYFENNGDGIFGPGHDISDAASADNIFVVDLNGDTKPDFTANGGAAGIRWFRNNLDAVSIGGRALSFSGTGGEAVVTQSEDFEDLSNLTLDLWFKPSSIGSNQGLIENYNPEAGGWYARITSANNIEFTVSAGGNDRSATSTSAISADTWHHLTATYDGTDITIYLDGENVTGTNTGSGSGTIDNSTNGIAIGNVRLMDSHEFNGIIDEVNMWNIVRPISDIRKEAFQKLNGNETGLIGYWRFNEESGTQLTDLTDNKNSGRIIGDVSIDTDTHPYGTFITGSEGWHMMASPVDGASYAALLDGLWTQGFAGASSSGGSPNVLTWNESTQSWNAPSNLSSTPPAGSGFIFYIYDDENFDGTPDGFPKKVLVDESQQTGRIDASISYNDTGNPTDDGWNLVGNPYGSTIEWSNTAGWTRDNLEAPYYVWNEAEDEYQSHNGVSGTLDNDLIAPWQGFWVQANGDSPTLKINDNVRSSGGTFLKQQPIPEIEFSLTPANNQNESSFSSTTIVMLTENASVVKDRMDAWKLDPLTQNYASLFTSLKSSAALDINALPEKLDESVSFGLDYSLTVSQDKDNSVPEMMELKWYVTAFPDHWNFVLTDMKNGDEINLRGENSIRFKPELTVDNSSKVSNDSAKDRSHQPLELTEYNTLKPTIRKSKNQNDESRFKLTIYPGNITSVESKNDLPNQITLKQNYPNPFNPITNIRYALPRQNKVTLEVYDVLGRKVATLVNDVLEAGIHQVQFQGRNLASGMYIYRLKAGNTVITKKLTLIK